MHFKFRAMYSAVKIFHNWKAGNFDNFWDTVLTLKAEMWRMQLKTWCSMFIKIRTPAFFTILVHHEPYRLFYSRSQFQHSPNWSRTSLNCNINHNFGISVVPLFQSKFKYSQIGTTASYAYQCLPIHTLYLATWFRNQLFILRSI